MTEILFYIVWNGPDNICFGAPIQAACKRKRIGIVGNYLCCFWNHNWKKFLRFYCFCQGKQCIRNRLHTVVVALRIIHTLLFLPLLEPKPRRNYISNFTLP